MAMRIDDTDVIDRILPIQVIIYMLIMVAAMFLTSKIIRDDPFLSPTEICQKHFGKDYAYQKGYHGPSFCVDSSGIPKYPKTWYERKSNA